MAAFGAALLASSSSLALACPGCLSGQDKLSLVMKLVGVFMLVPFLLVGLVVRAIRRAAVDAAVAPPPSASSSGSAVAVDGSPTATG